MYFNEKVVISSLKSKGLIVQINSQTKSHYFLFLFEIHFNLIIIYFE